MAGKSTYIRQAALLDAHGPGRQLRAGAAATIGVADRIFARVGASDDLARGRSTFMVEMTETARILNTATPRSLVILDEIGRGTSTYDGLSLAWAVVEHLHDRIGCRTLFATHYHELTDLAERLAGRGQLNVAVREWQDTIVFLHQIVPGAADKSYGIHVAQLAGVPREVNERAAEVLAELEAGQPTGAEPPRSPGPFSRDAESAERSAPALAARSRSPPRPVAQRPPAAHALRDRRSPAARRHPQRRPRWAHAGRGARGCIDDWRATARRSKRRRRGACAHATAQETAGFRRRLDVPTESTRASAALAAAASCRAS